MLINIHEAKTNFSKLINRVLKGDDIIIARDGKPLVRLIAYSETVSERHGGQLRGLIKISDDFDAPLPDDLLKQFYQDGK
ncbi:MAG: prevent-host-death family protein [uncultured bacterium]|nr:MAG: prevent-host-death family protein [uncultured bacterium]